MPSTNGSGRPPVGGSEAAYRACVHIAVFAALFSLVVCGLLVANWLQGRARFPVDPPAMVALKAQLAKRPADEALKARIRRLDREIREEYFGRKAFAEGGSLLLLAGVVVFVAALKGAKRLRRRLPKPGDPPEDPRRIAARARVVVATLGVVALAGLFSLGAGAGRDPAREYARAVGLEERAGRPRRRAASARELARNWPQFRGPGGSGLAAPSARPPEHWDGTKGTNIRWKVPVPLPGENSPVVWNDRVFLSGADEKQREVYCFAAADGKLLWRQPVGTGGAGATPPNVSSDTGYAAPTLATDGERVFALFATGHLACFTLDGKLGWLRNLGVPDNMYGHASSPVLHENRLIIQYDQGLSAEDGKSALLALDTATGQTIWETKRPVPNSWSTPLVVSSGGTAEIITCANPWVIAYDPKTGAEKWRVECLSGDVAPTPIAAGGLVLACNIGAPLTAIRPGGQGDVTQSAVAWSATDGIPDVTSPASNGELVWLVTTDGLVTCYDLKSGAKVWEHSLERMFWASPTVVGDRLYLLDNEGMMHILATGRTFRQLGTAPLGESVNASPAFVGDRVYIRGKENLYCIGR